MKKLVFALSYLCAVILVTSCKKVETTVGKDGIDNSLMLNSDAIDTFQLKTYTIQEDSLISSNLSVAMLGSYQDPIFGKFDANFYTQFRLLSFSPNFGDLSTTIIDSFVLGLEYKGYYGELDPQNFEVYQLADDLHLDSTYYSFTTKAYNPTNIVLPGHGTMTPNPLEETVIGTQTVESQLRIYLDTVLARTLMTEANTNSATFASNESFLQYFKGLHVKVNNPAQASGEGGVFYFNLNDPLSKLTIYYRQGGLNKTFDFLINTDCADFNHIDIDNAGTKSADILSNPALGQVEFYAQANQSRAVVEMSTINDIPKNALIEYAVLELPVNYYTYDPYFPSATVSVATKVSATDQTLYNLNVTGEYSDFTKSYLIDLRAYIQQVVSGNIENHGLFISCSKILSSAERIVFNGADSSNKKQPKLHLIYTTY